MNHERIAELYTQEFWTIEEIAIHTGSSLAHIRDTLERMGVPRRQRGESRIIGRLRKLAAKVQEPKPYPDRADHCTCRRIVKDRMYGRLWRCRRCGRFEAAA